MKYRTDFVTNSSSASSVLYKVSIIVSNAKNTRDLLNYEVEGEDELRSELHGIRTALNVKINGYNDILEAYQSVILSKIISLKNITSEEEKQNLITIVNDIVTEPCRSFEEFENSALWKLLGKASDETLLFLEESLEAYYHSWGSDYDYSYNNQDENSKEVIDFRDFDKLYKKLKCPKCNKKMTMRVSEFGPFYGCTNFPKCDGKVKVTDRKYNVESDFFIVKGKSGENILKMYHGKQANVIIPDDVNVIGEKAFQECRFIDSITIPSSVTRIEKYAFQQCAGIREITIPNSVQFIGESAFKWCASLKSITIPDSVTKISDRLFFSIDALSEVNLPDTIVSMGERVFYNCYSLQRIQLPAKITKISAGMFQECTNLTEVKAPGKISEIHEKAFYGCHKLKYIELSPNLHTVGNDALICLLTKKTLNPLGIDVNIKQPKQIWVTTETPVSFGESAFAWYGGVNFVFICNNYAYIKENLTKPIIVKGSNTFVFTDENQNNQIKIVSLSNEFAIKTNSLESIMSDIDKKINVLDHEVVWQHFIRQIA